MTRRSRYVGCKLLSISALVAGAARAAAPGLAPYMGRDLSRLSKDQRSIFLSRLARLTGDPRVQEFKQDVVAYWVTPYHSGNADRMLLMANPNWDIPGHPQAWIYLLTRDWRPVASSTFPLGEREFLIDARVSRDNPLGRDLLVVRVSSASPLHTFHPGDELLRVQYYACLQGRMALVREENIHGEPVRETYGAFGPDVGPTPPAYRIDHMLPRLTMGEPVEQAEILVWLTGRHSAGASASDKLTSWRDNSDVRGALEALRRSSNPWIAQYAALGFAAAGH